MKHLLPLIAITMVMAVTGCTKVELESSNAEQIPETKSTSSAVSTSTSTYFTNLFDTQGGGWTGGDGAYSIPLPDGRILWTFGDTFLGTVNPDYSRPGTGLLNNTFVVQDGNQLTTLYGGTAQNPEAYVRPADNPDHFYWPGDGTVIGDKLYMYMLRIRSTGAGGPFGFQHIGSDLAVFSLPDLELIQQERLIQSDEILAGVSIYEEDNFIYTYSTKTDFGKNALVARMPVDNLSEVRYWNGTTWSETFDGNAFMLLDDDTPLFVSNMFSVIKYEGSYLLLTQRDFLSNKTELYVGDSPVGPWRNRQVIYEAPEAGNGLWAYNASLHPHITHPTKGMLMTYSVNSADFLDLFEDVRNYRPRFVWVKPSS